MINFSYFSVVASGFATGLSLILAIGAQNAFVLKQGLLGRHVVLVWLTCALSDTLLIAFGVSGFHSLLQRYPNLLFYLRYAGIAFLLLYALRSAYSALYSRAGLEQNQADATSWQNALMLCLAFTWLNPHVYLDTVVFMGMISVPYGDKSWLFAVGASLASFVFFFCLSFGARYLRPWLLKPKAWRVLEAFIAALMLYLAWLLWCNV